MATSEPRNIADIGPPSDLPNHADFVIIGGGIIGLAVARQLLLGDKGLSVAVLEKENTIATHQTGHSSGVVHAGIYYRPGSQKAELTRRSIGMLREYVETHGVGNRPEQGFGVERDEGAHVDHLGGNTMVGEAVCCLQRPRNHQRQGNDGAIRALANDGGRTQCVDDLTVWYLALCGEQ